MDEEKRETVTIATASHRLLALLSHAVSVSMASRLSLHLPPSSRLCCPTDPGSGDPARHRGPAQDGRHGDAAVLRGRGRLRQHLRPNHQRRGAAVGRDAHIRRYVTERNTERNKHVS